MSSSDGLQQVSKIVNSLFNKPETLAFREPVNPKAMGIPDYPQIVKNPMDLGTVRLGECFRFIRQRKQCTNRFLEIFEILCTYIPKLRRIHSAVWQYTENREV